MSLQIVCDISRANTKRPFSCVLYYLLTYSIKRSPSWEAKFRLILWNPKVRYRIHKCPPNEPARSSPYPPHPTSWKSILILSTHLRLGLPSDLFPSGFPTKTVRTTLPPPTRATCPAYLILLDFIIHTILGEQYRNIHSVNKILTALWTAEC